MCSMSPAAGSEVSWCSLLSELTRLTLRPKQREALDVLIAGHDLLYIDRTGGGKSLVFQLPAAAMWLAAVKGGVALPPITLVVVPFISLGEYQASAMMRFLRPVCYQDVPDALLPAALQDANPLGLTRRVDGKLVAAA